MTDWLDIPLTAPPLSVWALRCLTAAGYRTFADLDAAPPSDRERVPRPGRGRVILGIGPISSGEVRQVLQETKVAHARALRASGLSLRQIATKAGVSHECVRRWLREPVTRRKVKEA